MIPKSGGYPVDGSLERGPQCKAQCFMGGIRHAAARPAGFTGSVRQLEVSVHGLKRTKWRMRRCRKHPLTTSQHYLMPVGSSRGRARGTLSTAVALSSQHTFTESPPLWTFDSISANLHFYSLDNTRPATLQGQSPPADSKWWHRIPYWDTKAWFMLLWRGDRLFKDYFKFCVEEHVGLQFPVKPLEG